MADTDFWRRAIEQLVEQIDRQFGVSVAICAEIECTVEGLDLLSHEDDFWKPLSDRLSEQLSLESIAKEDAPFQYEFRLKPTDPMSAAEELECLKQIVLDDATCHDVAVSFASFDGAASVSNGLHWHLHLMNKDGANVFLKQDEKLSPPLSDVLGGLLASLPATMRCFAPDDADYLRLNSGVDHVPKTVSWGGNNRSVALRLLGSVLPFRHIEHRVAGAGANPYACMVALLSGIHYGLTHHPDPGAQIYGNAHDAQYGMPRLPQNQQEAQECWDNSEAMGEYRELFAFGEAVSERAALI